MSGVTFPICVIATLVFAWLFMKKIHFTIQKHSVFYMAGMVLLGVSTALTDSFSCTFFNLTGIILLFFIFMIHQFYNDWNWIFPVYLKRIFILFGNIVECLPYPYWHGSGYFSRNRNNKSRNTLLAVVTGFLAAMGILSITLPLLLNSDMMFARIFGEVLRYINFSTIFGVSITVIAGFTLSYAMFGALCRYTLTSPEDRRRRLKVYDPVIGITCTSIVGFIYFIYCIIQIMYLFVGVRAGLPENVTYARYARGGFWELLFVSFINFVIVLLCMYLFAENIGLKAVLTFVSGCTFVMILSAAYRMFLYIGAYHLTFLRILVLWFLAVLTFIMTGTIINIYNKRFPLFHYIVAVVTVFYIGLSFSRPDAAVAEYNVAHMEEISTDDLYYLMYNTSLDAVPAIAKIEGDAHIEQRICNFFTNISTGSDGIYFRKANYSRIRAKLTADKWLKEHPWVEFQGR